LEFIDYPRRFIEQTGTPSGKASPLARHRQVLAWKPKRHHVTRRQVVRPGRANVIQRNRRRPPRRQQLPAVGVLLDVRHDLEPRPLKAEVEAAYTGE